MAAKTALCTRLGAGPILRHWRQRVSMSHAHPLYWRCDAVPANQVRLTQEEAAAVQRLQGLGFSEGECLEAYLAYAPALCRFHVLPVLRFV